VEARAAVDNLISVIQFPTISGLGPTNGSYVACAEWIISELQTAGLNASILPESKSGKPIVVATWRGIDSTLPSLLLNSHYDVVPIDESRWTVPAFDGITANGRIYGRGSQDMKSVCIQHIVALRTLINHSVQPQRDVHVTFLPDEEIGGVDGMNILIQSDWFSNLHIALALDEGLASEGDSYSIFYGERLPWFVRVKAVGNTGHGSRFIDGTASEMIVGVANKALTYRRQQKQLLHGGGSIAGCSHKKMSPIEERKKKFYH
jgi:aminoacylase